MTETKFKSKFGVYSSQVHKGALKAIDTRKAYRPDEVPDDMLEALESKDLGPRDKHLDHLMN